MKQGLFSRRPQILGTVIAGLGLTAFAAPAQAALISTSACDQAPLTQPFQASGDSASYKLVPGGSFVSGAPGWKLTGGAHTVADGPSDGSSALYLPAGSSAQSPFTCVNAAYPSFRFFARNDALLGSVLVQVVYTEPLVGEVAVPLGVVTLSGSWRPTPPMLTLSAVPGLLSGGTTEVALRFTAVLGPSQIADIFVDPRMRD